MVSHSSISKPDTKISNTMSRLRQRSRLRKLVRRRQTSNNNNGEHTLPNRTIVTPTNIVTEPVPKVDSTPSTSVIEIHPTAPAHNSLNQGPCRGDPTTQLPKCKPTDEQNYSSTITIPKRRYAVQSPQRQQTRGDLITISKSDDNIECVEDPVDDWALQQHWAGNRDPRFTSVSRAERRQMMKDGMWPLNGAKKIPPKPIPMDGNDNTERDPTIWVQKMVYVGSDQPPRYEYIESPTTGSKISQRPDTDSSDDDGQGECGRGGYENCPDNPANHRAMNHQRGDSDGC